MQQMITRQPLSLYIDYVRQVHCICTTAYPTDTAALTTADVGVQRATKNFTTIGASS
jgi:hypothetical protein